MIFGVSKSPPVERMSMTREPESEEVTKKNTTTAMARTLVTVDKGRPSRRWNKVVLVSTAPPSAVSMSPSLR